MNRLARAALCTLISVGMLALVPSVAFAAQPVCGETLMANTTLTADLDCSSSSVTALIMGKAGIVLNLNGHSIIGYGGAVDDGDIGVETNGYHHTVIKNGSIVNFSTGINVASSNDTLIKDLYLSPAADTDDVAINISYGVGNVVKNIELATGYGYGVYIYGAASSRIISNEFNQVGTGIYVENGSGNLFRGNYVNAPNYGVYEYKSTGSTYKNNLVENGSLTGFYMDCQSNGNIYLINNTARGFDSDGFYLSNCYDDESSWAPGTGSVIRGNWASHNGEDGFDATYTINSTWTWNHAVHNDDDGFYLYQPAGITMSHNVAKHSGNDGFDFEGTGSYAMLDFSWNKANYNDDTGMTADNGTISSHNIARHNLGGNCYNVACN